ncbi:hypothetical protein brsh051_14030 [Brooklawnia propionicigenes]|uniref:GtrA/DPMS transmembrane domain-containing protein n=1 Tax=Brooklawnia propionicigenes TaxID=3041175 RepID=A0AAN0K9S0_9ACTN|nr:GtrA family protein [Brooklawnia sp. SH051]BEH02122.1 hypothetical protein brsh051_14030 [Brooklawnia sp. SH051]
MNSLIEKAPPVLRQVVRYGLVGGSAFLLDFGMLWALRSGLGLPAWLAAAFSYIVATLYSFTLQRKFTFSADLNVGNSALRYGILLVVNMVLTSAIVEAFDYFLDLYLVGKVVSTVAMTMWNFPIMKFWVYPQSKVSAAVKDASETKG